jgi:hypothetical protein
MNAISVLSEAGIFASIEPPDGVRLKGLSKLQGEKKRKIIEYAKNHKLDILSELVSRPFNLRDWKFPDHLPQLPDGCPLTAGGTCPPGCRYETRFLARMIETGILPDPDKGCPLRHVCGLFSEWPRSRPEYPAVEDEPPAPEPGTEEIRCDTCPAWDAEYQRCYGVPYFEHKAGPWVSGREAALKQCC